MTKRHFVRASLWLAALNHRTAYCSIVYRLNYIGNYFCNNNTKCTCFGSLDRVLTIRILIFNIKKTKEPGLCQHCPCLGQFYLKNACGSYWIKYLSKELSQVLQLSLYQVVSCKMPPTPTRRGTSLGFLVWCAAYGKNSICVASSREAKTSAPTVTETGSFLQNAYNSKQTRHMPVYPRVVQCR